MNKNDLSVMTDAGVRAKTKIGRPSRRRLAKELVAKRRRARSWIRLAVMLKVALVTAVLMVE